MVPNFLITQRKDKTEWYDFSNVTKVLQNVKFPFGSRGLWPDLSLPFGRQFQFCCQDTFKSSRADHSPSFKQ